MPCRCVSHRYSACVENPFEEHPEEKKPGDWPKRLAAAAGVTVLVAFAVALLGSVAMLVLLPVSTSMGHQARQTWPVLLREAPSSIGGSR